MKSCYTYFSAEIDFVIQREGQGGRQIRYATKKTGRHTKEEGKAK